MNKRQNYSDSFIDAIYALGKTTLPGPVIHHARRCLLDYLGVTIAGAAMAMEKNNRLLNQLADRRTPIERVNSGDRLASVIGMNLKADLLLSALVNGLSSHQAELDDGVISGIVHPGAPIFSAILPWAQVNQANGEQLIRGIVTGYEATVRIANTVQPSHKRRGFHATGTCGTIGAALALSMMVGAGKKEMKDSLSAASLSACGSLKALEDDSELKPFNPAQAAVSALMACSLARAGFAGPDDALAGERGFLEMMSDEFDIRHLDFPTQNFAIESVYFKPYAACRYCHPPIEAALELRKNRSFSGQDVKSIRVATYDLAVRNHDHTRCESVASAKMSIPFSVAVALDQGAAGIREYTAQTIRSGSIDSLMKLVAVTVDNEFTAAFPNKTSARVEITMQDGSAIEAIVNEPKGDPGNPLSDAEVTDKFMNLAFFAGMPSEQSSAIRDAVWNLPEDAGGLYELL